MPRLWIATIEAILLACSLSPQATGRSGGASTTAQNGAVDAIAGVLAQQPSISAARARERCIDLPADLTDDLIGPHGDTILSADCKVVAYEPLGLTRWSRARYVRTIVFTAEDKTRGADARDTVTLEEAVLLERAAGEALTPVWHLRFETGAYGVWRSLTPDVALTSDGTTLLSIMACVNGTGGCGQEFLHRHADSQWFPVTQTWRDELPRDFVSRIRHGFHIEPQTLRGEAGFYGDDDPNCCPSQILEFELQLRGDSLVLRGPARVRKGAG
jgi:hypothetical protein